MVKSIAGYDENRWKEVGLKLVRPGITAKLEQDSPTITDVANHPPQNHSRSDL